jgi:prepilin-type N-terminal cleavage/methylation domain-containing protein
MLHYSRIKKTLRKEAEMKRKGFTLLELLIVVIIVGILAAIAVPQFFRVAERARSTELVNVLGSIRSAQMRYYSEHATFTDNVDTLDVDIPDGTAKYYDGHTAITLPGGTFSAATVPVANITRNNYQYTGASPYTLSMDAQGNITCTGDAATCTKLGY